ncbi:unnamed protein product [Prorocentrum cordatum]|uniref:Uncharacterized protein n=1 Tax=Prorocentrum cordatum TaxID=2364126 RepID=A0ABN9Y6Q7_9DINO|nr:unnamed protein product [Polarella glacialis]
MYRALDQHVHFSKFVTKASNNRISIEKYTKDVACLGNLENKSYPNGCRAFRSNDTQIEHDNVLKYCRDVDSTFTATIPRGTANREAMRIVRHGMTLSHTQSVLEALEEHREAIKLTPTKQAFMEQGKAIMASLTEDKATPLGFDAPAVKGIDPKVQQEKLEMLWSTVIQNDAAREQKRLKDLENEDKARKKNIEQAFRERPEDMCSAAVDTIIDKKLEQHCLLSNMAEDNVPNDKTVTFADSVQDQAAGTKSKVKGSDNKGATGRGKCCDGQKGKEASPPGGDADLAVISRMERWDVHNLARFGTKLYLRFQDNILFQYERTSLAGTFVVEFRRRAEYLKLKALRCRRWEQFLTFARAGHVYHTVGQKIRVLLAGLVRDLQLEPLFAFGIAVYPLTAQGTAVA